MEGRGLTGWLADGLEEIFPGGQRVHARPHSSPHHKGVDVSHCPTQPDTGSAQHMSLRGQLLCEESPALAVGGVSPHCPQAAYHTMS